MQDTAPLCPGKFATLVLSLRSQILIILSSVPVPKISPSGWNWEQVNPPGEEESLPFATTIPFLISENAQWLSREELRR